MFAFGSLLPDACAPAGAETVCGTIDQVDGAFQTGAVEPSFDSSAMATVDQLVVHFDSPATGSGGGLPAGATILISIFVGLVGPYWLRRTGKEARMTAVELDSWRKREETMRLVRWAAEQAFSDNPRQSMIGQGILDSVLGSTLLQREDRAFVESIFEILSAGNPSGCVDQGHVTQEVVSDVEDDSG